MNSLRTKLSAWLFEPTDAIIVGLFRVPFALYMLLWLHRSIFKPLASAPFAEETYTHFFDTPAYIGLCSVLLVLLAIGIGARIVALALVVLLAPFFFDEYVGMSFVYPFIVPFALLRSDARFSLASRLRKGPRPSTAGPMWPIHLMAAWLAALYIGNGLAKCSPSYLRGDYLLLLADHAWNFFPTSEGRNLVFMGYHIPAGLASIGSALTELSIGIALLIPRTRVFAAIGGIGFHLSLHFIIQIGSLDKMAILLYPLFFIPFANRPFPGLVGYLRSFFPQRVKRNHWARG